MVGASWHSKSLASIFEELFTSESGLTEKKAEERLSRFGKNEIVQPEKSPWFVMLLSQFYSLPILLLLGAAAISLFLGLTVDHEKLIDAGAILVAILLAAFFGFWQEYKAESALAALKKMVVQHCLVVRGKRQLSVDAKTLVPGDIVVLEEGSRVPADIRIIESVNLAVDQSTLTGESRPVEKEACTLYPKAVLAERRNMLFAGTTIVRGHAKGLVVETGMQTEFGKIVGYLSEEEEPETPLQKSLDNLAKTLGYIGIAAAVIFFAFGLFRGETAVSMFVVAVTLAVAVIPEGLPTVLAITLAIGVQKMAKRNAIVRRMTAVETLGSATVICTDKTGTLTLNKMTVQELVFAEKSYSISKGSLDSNAPRRDPVLSRALEIMALCNNAARADEDGVSTIKGDPTEAALLNAVVSCGGSDYRIRSQHRQVGEVPFDSDRKMMSSIRLFEKKRFALVKGAPEKILPRCSSVLLRKGEGRLTQEEKQRMISESQSLGQQGMRVLALAYRQVPKLAKYTSGNTERSLVFVGLVAMEDPPRPEVSDAIALCQSAGIRVVMITGDSLPTAQAIATRIGLLKESQDVLDGAQLEEMDDQQLSYAIKSTAVFARATPEQKYRIVTAFMKSGEVVAVTGDGVNDS
ncbi:MAG: HAD-IC family P-type ATPase, partial [Candidatus Anstonellaceae archaeon]